MGLKHDVENEAAPTPNAAARQAAGTPIGGVDPGPEAEAPTPDAVVRGVAAARPQEPAKGDGDELAEMDRDRLLHFYAQMALIRELEQRAAEMYARARIGGYCHLNLGEEATVVGFCAGLEPDDYVYTNYREHGYAVGRGISPNAVMAELFGKETGCSRGRGGSMHLFDVDRHFMGGYAIVGGQIPLATGAAFAVAYRGGHEVVACQMGDGTTNGGQFHESLNMAKLYSLPIVYFVVNNQYAMGTPVASGSAEGELYRKACAYDMRSDRVDGNDVLAVERAVREAARVAREQHEPSLIEAVSFRWRGHSVVDPDRYRDKSEVEAGRSQDPIARFARELIDAGVAAENDLRSLDERARQEIDEAVRFADESPDPPVESLYEYMYAQATTPPEGR